MKEDRRKFNPQTFKPGQSGNPSGRPKGIKSQKVAAWNALKDSIINEHTEVFNNCMRELAVTDKIIFMRMYLMTLEYFKPKMSMSSSENSELMNDTIILDISGKIAVELPSNTEDDNEIGNEYTIFTEIANVIESPNNEE